MFKGQNVIVKCGVFIFSFFLFLFFFAIYIVCDLKKKKKKRAAGHIIRYPGFKCLAGFCIENVIKSLIESSVGHSASD